MSLASRTEISTREGMAWGLGGREGSGDRLPVTSGSAHRTCFLQGRGAGSEQSSGVGEGEEVGQGRGTEVREATEETGSEDGGGLEGGAAHSADGHCGPGRAAGEGLGNGARRDIGTGGVEGQEATDGSGSHSPKGTRYEGRARPMPRGQLSGPRLGILHLLCPLKKRKRKGNYLRGRKPFLRE